MSWNKPARSDIQSITGIPSEVLQEVTFSTRWRPELERCNISEGKWFSMPTKHGNPIFFYKNWFQLRRQSCRGSASPEEHNWLSAATSPICEWPQSDIFCVQNVPKVFQSGKENLKKDNNVSMTHKPSRWEQNSYKFLLFTCFCWKMEPWGRCNALLVQGCFKTLFRKTFSLCFAKDVTFEQMRTTNAVRRTCTRGG